MSQILQNRLSQQKKFGRRGVGALFSSQETRSRTGFFMGIMALVVGLVLWIVYIVGVADRASLGLLSVDPFVSLTLPPIGLLLVISGTGVARSFRERRVSATVDELAVEQEAQTTRLADRDQKAIHELNDQGTWEHRATLKLGVAVFVESLFVILLYAGVLDEYAANLSMQGWVRLSFPSVQIFLNQGALTIVSGILALVVIRFLPARRLHD